MLKGRLVKFFKECTGRDHETSFCDWVAGPFANKTCRQGRQSAGLSVATLALWVRDANFQKVLHF
jgi:hypothetical protein